MSDARFRDRQRAALTDALFPSWTIDAACRGQELPGRVSRAHFTDEVGQQQDIANYAWPEKTVNAMRTCAGCPVKRECLEAEFTDNPHPRQFGVRGGVPGRIREALGFTSCSACGGKGYTTRLQIGSKTLRFSDYSDAFEAGTPGFPCRACKQSGKVPDPTRIDRCAEWQADYAAGRGWAVLDQEENVGT